MIVVMDVNFRRLAVELRRLAVVAKLGRLTAVELGRLTVPPLRRLTATELRLLTATEMLPSPEQILLRLHALGPERVDERQGVATGRRTDRRGRLQLRGGKRGGAVAEEPRAAGRVVEALGLISETVQAM